MVNFQRDKRLEYWIADRSLEQGDDMGQGYGIPLDTSPNSTVFQRGKFYEYLIEFQN